MSPIENIAIKGFKDLDLPHMFINNQSDHLAIFLPGMGYTNERPLLYYPAKHLLQHQLDVLRIDYRYNDITDFNEATYETKKEWMKTDIKSALDAIFKKKKYAKVSIICKSLGTLAVTEVLDSHPKLQEAEIIWITPLCQNEEVVKKLCDCNHRSLLIIGTSDPCYIEANVKRVLQNPSIQSLIIPNADHSLEIENDIEKSIEVMKNVFITIKKFIKNN